MNNAIEQIMRNMYCIIADDFTGAGDSAVQFRKNGYSAFLPLRNWDYESAPDKYDVLVISTETRFMSPEESRVAVRSAVERCNSLGISRLFKKIDSTLRGHVGAEIASVLESSRYECAVVAPSVPENGRTVVNGHCLVDGIPITAEAGSMDVFNPVSNSSVISLLESDFPDSVGLVDITVIRAGVDAFRSRLDELREQGCRVIVTDSETMDDLEIIASVQDDSSILFAGASGLAEALSLDRAEEPGPLITRGTEVIPPENQMYVVGSITRVSQNQLDVLQTSSGILVVTLDIKNMMEDESAELARVLRQIGNYSTSLPIAVKTSKSESSLKKDIKFAVENGVKEIELGELISGFLGKLTVEIFKIRHIDMLFLTGGNTAARIVEALGISGIEFINEILPGIPLGKFELPGRVGAVNIVTKAGGFGQPDSLVKIHDIFSNGSDKIKQQGDIK